MYFRRAFGVIWLQVFNYFGFCFWVIASLMLRVGVHVGTYVRGKTT